MKYNLKPFPFVISILLLSSCNSNTSTSDNTPATQTPTVVQTPQENSTPNSESESDTSDESSVDYVTISDESNLIKMKIPSNWERQTKSIIEDNGDKTPLIIASPNNNKYIDTFEVPGVEVTIKTSQIQPVDLSGQCKVTKKAEKANFQWYKSTEAYVVRSFECGDDNNGAFVERISRLYLSPQEGDSDSKGSSVFFKVAYQVSSEKDVQTIKPILDSIEFLPK